ncbi:hypothetical protein Tco_0273254 [Tanacetum coccineum]
MELVQGATPICEGSCRLTSLERQEVWNDCRSCKVRVGSNGNLLWEASVLLGRKKVRWNYGVTEGEDDVREGFQQRGRGSKEEAYFIRCEGLGACLEKGRGDLREGRDILKVLKKDCMTNVDVLLDLSYSEYEVRKGIAKDICCLCYRGDSHSSMDVLKFEDGMERMNCLELWKLRGHEYKSSMILQLVKVRWDSKRGPELTWERKDQMRSKCPQLFVDSANASSS